MTTEKSHAAQNLIIQRKDMPKGGMDDRGGVCVFSTTWLNNMQAIIIIAVPCKSVTASKMNKISMKTDVSAPLLFSL